MIGYYAHHQGAGHITRADAIARAAGEPVTVLSSRVRPDGHAASEWVELPLDTHFSGDYVDVTAGGVVHWAPLDVQGLTGRMARIAAWVARVEPSVVVVDVSVEVTLFLRMMGIRVVVMAMPGDRTDAVHQTAYRAATAVVAPWSQQVYDPLWLREFHSKTTYCGSISRFAGRRRPDISRSTVVVLGGAGGTSLTARMVEAWTAADPRHTIVAVGVAGSVWVDDIWPVLCSAAVVVTAAGQNSIADVAAARTPTVVVAQDRPYHEQIATAEALELAGLAVVRTQWPTPEEWWDTIDRAIRIGGHRWAAVNVDGAAGRAAAAIEVAAAGAPK